MMRLRSSLNYPILIRRRYTIFGTLTDIAQKKIKELDIFSKDIPLSLCKDNREYNGDFPNENMIISKDSVANMCGLEVSTESLESRIKQSGIAPEWLIDVRDQEQLFYRLLDKNNLSGAWFCLNSKHWKISKMKPAILELAKQANDHRFNKLAQAWVSIRHED